MQIFINYIRSSATHFSNYKEYKVVCNIIKTFNKVADKEKTIGTIEELRERHSNRPAFLDELSKSRLIVITEKNWPQPVLSFVNESIMLFFFLIRIKLQNRLTLA